MREKTAAPAKQIGRNRLFALLAIVLSIIVGLAIIEGVLRVAGIGYGHAPMNPHPVMHHVHPPDFSFVAYDPGGEFGGYQVYYDRDGRVADPAQESAASENAHERTIALVGDSFAEGAGLPYQSSIAGLLNGAADSGVHIYNYGVAGYSPALYTVQWSAQIRDTAPAHVILILYSNDVTDDKRYAKLAEFDASGAIRAVPNLGNIWLKRLLRNSYLARLIRRGVVALTWDADSNKLRFIEGATGGFLEENPDLGDNTRTYLREFVDKVTASSAGLTITAIPSKVRVLDPSRRTEGPSFAEKVASWAEKNGLDYLDLTEIFYVRSAAPESSAFFETDIHLNETGAALVAGAIQNHLAQYFSDQAGD